MNELMSPQKGRSGLRWGLMATTSALGLCVTAFFVHEAKAESAERPSVWIELGGQLERVSGTSDRFSAPFLLANPQPGPFGPTSPIDAQHPPRYALGGEARITFEPEGTDWIFSAGIRYGRSSGRKHVHYQTKVSHPPLDKYGNVATSTPAYLFDFADTKAPQSEAHTVVDFAVGRDVGLGMFGPGSASIFNFGIRFAQFTAKATADIHARPNLSYHDGAPGTGKYRPIPSFHIYTLFGQSKRSFHGVGPSLSWNASATVVGAKDGASFSFDWGVNGSLLFGRQKAVVHHSTTAYSSSGNQNYTTLYKHTPMDRNRSHSVVVPNLGGFAGFSLNYSNARVSLGYRADFFFGAMDGGIDARNAANVAFHGPFATISIGLP